MRSVLSGRAEEAMAPHMEEMSRRSALLAKVKVLRDGLLINRGKIVGDPTKEYKWVNINPDRQLYFQGLGWMKVDADCDVTTSYQRDDGTHIRGDLILYQIDKEMAMALHEYDVIMGLERVNGARDGFINEAQKMGIRPFIPTL